MPRRVGEPRLAGSRTTARALTMILALVALAAVLDGRRTEAARTPRSPVGAFRAIRPDSVDAQFDLIAAAPAAFAADVDSALAARGFGHPEERAFLHRAAERYLDATGDSLLVWDYEFVASRSDADRTRWGDGVRADANGAALRAGGSHAGSAVAFRRAAAIYREVGHLRREAVAWGSCGVSAWTAGDLDGVADAYAEALEARERLGDPVLIGRTLNGIGSLNFRRGDYAAARKFYERARAVRETLPNRKDLGTTLAYLGNVDYRLGNLEAARAEYLRALDAFGPDASSAVTRPARVGLGNVHHDLGEYREAVALYEEIVRAAEADGDVRDAALYRRNLAQALIDMGRPADALRELDRVREALEEDEDPSELAAVRNTTGIVYRSLGDLRRAMEEFTEAQRLAAQGDAPLVEASVLINQGAVYAEWNLLEKALEAYARAGALLEGIDAPIIMRDILFQEANAHVRGGDTERALALYRQALAADEARAAKPLILEDLGNIGNALAGMGRVEESRIAYRRAIALAEEVGAGDPLWAAYLGLADTYERVGDLDSARVNNEKAIVILESYRGGGLSEETKTEFLGRRAFVYDAQVNVLAKLAAATGNASYEEEAFQAAERGKARALLDLLAASGVDSNAGLDSATVVDRDHRVRSLTAVRYRLRQAVEEGAPADTVRALKARVAAQEKDLAAFLETVRLRDPRFAALDAGRPRSLAEIRAALLAQKGSALLEYALGDSASYGWLVTAKELKLFALPPRERIEAEVQRLRAGLVNPQASGDAQYFEAAAALYATAVGPVAKDVSSVRHVIIVPDGALQFVPFEALLTVPAPPPDPGLDPAARNRYFAGLRYAFGGRDVRYGPSATTLVELARAGGARAASTKRELLAVGDPRFYPEAGEPGAAGSVVRAGALAPLPQTRAEVEAIAKDVPADRRTVLLGSDARESTLEADGFLGEFRILHFATHGLVDERRPERSSLALSFPSDPSEDGYLQASEIYRLRLRADLVTLSACETGLGRMVRGEGVLGLPRAFFFAGAPSVVVSLWSVSDRSTADLMQRFYARLLKKGQAPGEALAGAKQDLREAGEFSHPFHWAPFVLLGTGGAGRGK